MRGGTGAMAETPIPMSLAHAAGQRLRLALADPADAARLEALAAAVARAPSVAAVSARPLTGSLVVETAGPAGDALDWIEAAGLVRLVPDPGPSPVRKSVRTAAETLDRAILLRTRGVADLRSGLAAAIIAGDALSGALLPRR